jgi:hypothetical protein
MRSNALPPRCTQAGKVLESLGCRKQQRQCFQPRKIEEVVIAAADELDAAVAGLDGGEVAVVLGAGVAEFVNNR